jgi:hypothetical protein
MPVLATLALANLKSDLGKLWQWLCHRSFWQLVSMALAAACLLLLYQRNDARHDLAAYKSNAVKIQQKLDAANRKIADEIRKRTDEENRRIAADADGLRLSGPGRARACAPAAPGGRQPASGKPDAAGPEMPSDDSAAVPWNWLVQRAETNDLNRAEVLAWRDWYDRLLKQWPKSN